MAWGNQLTGARTEGLHEAAAGLDMRPEAEILTVLLAGQQAALAALESARPALVRGAAAIAETMRGPGRLVYAAAGSSALMALADAAELPGTFGIPAERILLRMAGGVPVDARMPGGVEDDTDAAARDATGIGVGDLVIAISASGATPYTLELVRIARDAGARIVGVANNENAPLFELSDVAICLPTPPEAVAGSTRMGAGTAQKAALNLMSTLAAMKLGHVHDGMMVNLRADNEKLRARAAGMVAVIAGVGMEEARACLDSTGGAVKAAVLLARGAGTPARADALLAEAEGQLRAALTRI